MIKNEQTPLFPCRCSNLIVCRFHSHSSNEKIILCLCVHGSAHMHLQTHIHTECQGLEEKKNNFGGQAMFIRWDKLWGSNFTQTHEQ